MLDWIGRRTVAQDWVSTRYYLAGRPVQTGQVPFEFKFTTAQSDSQRYPLKPNNVENSDKFSLVYEARNACPFLVFFNNIFIKFKIYCHIHQISYITLTRTYYIISLFNNTFLYIIPASRVQGQIQGYSALFLKSEISKNRNISSNS